MRVVVTGVGVISSLGLRAEGFWQSLLACRPGIGPLQNTVHRVETAPLRFENVAEVTGYDAEAIFDPK